jgi:hypothetical protein
MDTTEKRAAYNSTYKKLAVQWLNEALFFVSSSVVADSFRLRNRQLLVAAKRCASCKKEKNEMFANKEIESQLHKAKSANAHIAFLPTVIK